MLIYPRSLIASKYREALRLATAPMTSSLFRAFLECYASRSRQVHSGFPPSGHRTLPNSRLAVDLGVDGFLAEPGDFGSLEAFMKDFCGSSSEN